MRQMAMRHRARIFFLGFLILETAVMIWDITARHMVVSDPLVTFISQYYRLNGVAQYGQIPLWTPFMTHGSAVTWWFALQGNSGFLLNAAVLLGGLLKQVDFFALFHMSVLVDKLLFLAGIWLLSQRYYERLASRVFVMLCAGSFFVLFTQTGFGFFLFYAIPLILWLGHRFLETGRWRFLFLMAYLYIVQAVSAVAYHIPVSTFAIALYFACDALFRHEEYALRLRALCFGRPFLVCLAGIALMGLTFLVYLHLAQDPGNMVNASPMRNVDGSMPLQTFLTYAGNMHLNKWNELFLRVSPAWDYTLYMGMFALPCLVAGAFFCGREQARLWLAWTAVIFLISIGSVVAVVVYYFWPLMNYYRHLSLLAPLVKLGLCFLAGFGFEALFRPAAVNGERPLWWHRVFFAGMAVMFAGIALFLQVLRDNEALRAWIVDGLVTAGLPKFPLAALNLDLVAALILVLMVAAMCAAIVFITTPRALAVAAWIWLGFQAIDMGVYRWDQTKLRALVLDKPALATTRFQPLTWRPSRNTETWADDGRAAVLQAGAGRFAIYHMVSNFTFYDYLSTPLRTDSWQRPLDYFLRARLNRPLEDGELLNTKTPSSLYFQFHDAMPLKVMGALKDKIQVFDQAYYFSSPQSVAALIRQKAFAGDVLLLSSYEGRPFAGRADDHPTPEELSSNSRRDVDYQVSRYSPNEVVINVRLPEGKEAWLMYSDVWHPSWKATVNGRPVPVYAADLAYKAVPLTGGANVVRFYFDAPLLTAVQWFYALAALAGLGLTGWACARAWQAGEAAPQGKDPV